MNGTYWIQHADLSVEELGSVAAEAAVAAFEGVDWVSEVNAFEVLQSEERENCPPGIGYKAADGRILHICPSDSDNALCFYHYPNERGFIRRLLGITQSTVTADRFPLSGARRLINSFFAGQHHSIVAQLKEAAG